MDDPEGCQVTEVPLVFHELLAPRFRFENGRILPGGATAPGAPDGALQHRAAASVTHMDVTTFVSTSLLKDEPSVLVVARKNRSGTQLVQLDLGDRIPLKIQAFAPTFDNPLRLIIVDTTATVTVVHLDPETLRPEESYSECKVLSYLPPNMSASTLCPSMVGIWDSTRLLLALKPVVVAVDFIEHKVETWSHSRTVERMGRSLLGSLWQSTVGSTVDFVTGKAMDGLVDMPAVAALTVVEELALTFHADGSLRKWTLAETSLQPVAVYDLGNPVLPPPDHWSGDPLRGALMKAMLYENVGKVHVVAIAVHTEREAHIVVVDATADRTAPSHELDVPTNLTNLVDLALCPGHASLRCLFVTPDKSSVVVVFPRCNQAIVSRRATVIPSEDLVEPYPLPKPVVAEALRDVYELEPTERLSKRLHAHYLKKLFQPKHSAPSLSTIRKAWKACHAGTSLKNALDFADSSSMPRYLLLAMVQWRQIEVKGSASDGADPGQAVLEREEQRWLSLFRNLRLVDFGALCLSIPLSYPTDDAFIVRSRATSVLARPGYQPAWNPLSGLDLIVRRILTTQQENHGLAVFRARAEELVASAQLAMSHDPDCLALPRSVKDDIARSLEQADLARIHECLGNIRNVQAMNQLPLGSPSPGLCLLERKEVVALPRDVDNHDGLSMVSLSLVSATSLAELYLGRWLLLSLVSKDTELTALALVNYIRVLSMSWTWKQTITDSTLQSSRDHLGGERDATILDYLLRSTPMEDAAHTSGSSFARCSALTTASSLVRSFSHLTTSTHEAQRILPELRLLPDSHLLFAQARVGLRLLAPARLLAVVNHAAIDDARAESVAEFLLVALQSNDPVVVEETLKEVSRLIQFDPNDLTRSMTHLDTMVRHVGQNVTLATKLESRIRDAIQSLDALIPVSERAACAEYSTLWKYVFDLSSVTQQWESAVTAIQTIPDLVCRVDLAKRMAVSMVRSGHLRTLVQMCRSFDAGSMYRLSLERSRRGQCLFDIAEEALNESIGDVHLASDLVTSIETVGALFTLQVSREKWRQAAQSLDRLASRVVRLMQKRSRSIESDQQMLVRLSSQLVYASCGASFALGMCDLRDEAFLVSDVASEPYQSVAETGLRCVWNSVVAAVFLDGARGSAFGLLDLVSRSPNEAFRDMAVELSSRGMLGSTLALARALSEHDVPACGGVDPQQEMIEYLICSVLVPVAYGLSSSSSISIPLLFDAMDDGSSPLPCLHTGRLGVKTSVLNQQVLSSSCQEVIRILSTRYTSRNRPVAVEAARAILQTSLPRALPFWLEQLLVFGNTTEKSSSPLSFGHHDKCPMFSGDPSALLSLYMRYGLVEDAVRVAVLCLSEQGGSSANRVPEKGDVDCIPYRKLDLLDRLLEKHLASSHGAGRTRLVDARSRLESSLQNYLSSLKIAQAGLRSARALS